MGWRMFRASLREMNASKDRDARAQQAQPESWAGAQHDGWWPSSRRR